MEKNRNARPVVIAGPCTAESREIVDAVAEMLAASAAELGFQPIFKTSFDKANRTSSASYRGPGFEKCRGWLDGVKSSHKMPLLLDVHETQQVAAVAEIADWLQIPAFLCRQTDLLVAAVRTGRSINIKKGQWLAPETTAHLVQKARSAASEAKIPVNVALTERGTIFGYGRYIVDMRGLSIMAGTGAQVFFDATHSVQLTSAGGAAGEVSGGERQYVPLLARAAVATGYVDGIFIEIHPDPAKAKSDKDTQLSLGQARALLRQIVPFWKACHGLREIDGEFK